MSSVTTLICFIIKLVSSVPLIGQCFIIRIVSSVGMLGVKASDWMMLYYENSEQCECALNHAPSLHSFLPYTLREKGRA